MSQIREVKEATDIVALIGEKISLQRSGSSFRGLCPFHSEKSPSFFVNEQFQRYKCFGCGEHGDALTFLEKYEGMTFGEAIKYLAERAGITLESYKPTAEDDSRLRLLSLLSLAKEYYHFLLTQHELGEPARHYLKERGVTAESIRLFQLGYALPSWDGLIKYLHLKKKYSLAELQQAGMVVTNQNNKIYDRFRQRLMFPLTNHRGQIVGFSGRVLDKESKEAKYINTPETALYHKSEMLFGYSELFQNIRQKREVIVVEGEFDVISSAQAHVNNVVAIKGSAVTQDHLRLISRAADKVIFSLDVDSAGVKATKRAIEQVGEMPLEVRVISVPSGKDPDELARTQPKEWRESSKASISVYDFLLQAALKQFDANTAEGKRAIIDELAPVFGRISHAVEQEVYFKKLAGALQTKEEIIKRDVERFKVSKQAKRIQSSWSNVAESAPETKLSLGAARTRRLEDYLIYVWWQGETVSSWARLHQLEPSWFSQSHWQLLIKVAQLQRQAVELAALSAQLDEETRQVLFETLANPNHQELITTDEQDREFSNTLAELQQILAREKIALINEELTELDKVAQPSSEQEARQAFLLSEIVRWQKQGMSAVQADRA